MEHFPKEVSRLCIEDLRYRSTDYFRSLIKAIEVHEWNMGKEIKKEWGPPRIGFGTSLLDLLENSGQRIEKEYKDILRSLPDKEGYTHCISCRTLYYKGERLIDELPSLEKYPKFSLLLAPFDISSGNCDVCQEFKIKRINFGESYCLEDNKLISSVAHHAQ